MRAVFGLLLSGLCVSAWAASYAPPVFTVSGANQSGFNATLTTTDVEPPSYFQLTFDYPAAFTISSVWGDNATMTKNCNSETCSYVIIGTANNAALDMGFYASGDASKGVPDPTNMVLEDAPPPPPCSTVLVPKSAISINQLDTNGQALEYVMTPGQNTNFTLTESGSTSPTFNVATSHQGIVTASISGGVLTLIAGDAAGRTALAITDPATGNTRYIGILVEGQDGKRPAFPNYVALASVNENAPTHVQFFEDFTKPNQSKFVDMDYIYLNGGNSPSSWVDQGNHPGDRACAHLQYAQALGMMPFFVYYNIPSSNESYDTDLEDMQSQSYMTWYYQNLVFLMQIINKVSPNDPVGIILEPDLLGYMEQNANASPADIQAAVNSAYSSGVLQEGVDPSFPNNLQGLVESVNYIIQKYGNDNGANKHVYYGWEFSLWADPNTNVPQGVIHGTPAQITAAADEIASFYKDAGVLSYGADFISVDKYGLDAAAFAGDSQPWQNPATSTWFWNIPMWNNYLTFVGELHKQTGLPVVLWQMPVGHIGISATPDPYAASFPALQDDMSEYYEDSTPDFFFGDTFNAESPDGNANYTTNRCAYFGIDAKTSGSCNITWPSGMQAAAAAGVEAVMFGAGVGISTHSIGVQPTSPKDASVYDDTDNYWWITKAEDYYQHPTPLLQQPEE